MSTPVTTNYGFKLPNLGSQNWGDDLNENFESIDAALVALEGAGPGPGGSFILPDGTKIFVQHGTTVPEEAETGDVIIDIDGVTPEQIGAVARSFYENQGDMAVSLGAGGIGVLSKAGTNGFALFEDSAAPAGIAYKDPLTQLKFPRGRFVTDRWKRLLNAANATLTTTLNRAYAVPFEIADAAQVLKKIQANITVAADGGTLRFALYASLANGLPGDLIAELGTAAATGTGVATADFSLSPVTPGKVEMVFAAVVHQGSTSTPAGLSVGGDPTIRLSEGTISSWTSLPNCYTRDTVSGAFPASWGSSATASTNGPNFALMGG